MSKIAKFLFRVLFILYGMIAMGISMASLLGTIKGEPIPDCLMLVPGSIVVVFVVFMIVDIWRNS